MNTSSVTESARALANGASRELQAVNQRITSSSKHLAHAVGEQGAVLLQNAAKGLQSAGRSARQHPWITSAAVATGLVALGGFLLSRRMNARLAKPKTAPRRSRASAS